MTTEEQQRFDDLFDALEHARFNFAVVLNEPHTRLCQEARLNVEAALRRLDIVTATHREVR